MDNPRKPRKWWLYGVFLAAAGLLVAGAMAMRTARPTGETVRQQMIQVSQVFVRGELTQGLQTVFAGDEETTVEALPEGKFLISGWVDIIDRIGRQDRQNFSLVIYKNPYGTWMGERISVIPQM